MEPEITIVIGHIAGTEIRHLGELGDTGIVVLHGTLCKDNKEIMSREVVLKLGALQAEGRAVFVSGDPQTRTNAQELLSSKGWQVEANSLLSAESLRDSLKSLEVPHTWIGDLPPGMKKQRRQEFHRAEGKDKAGVR
ncbi:hypothetical protein JNK13_06415 [bacterium]|nr:hypothetical protein [bacterium]